MTKLTKIVLHGRLAEKFGEEINLGVDTPAQAINALMTLKPGFRDELSLGEYQVIRGSLKKGFDIDTDLFDLNFGKEREFHIIPAMVGAKQGGTVKIIVGAVLIVAAIALAIPSGGSSVLAAIQAGASYIGVSAGALAVLGAGILLSGISEALAPQPWISGNDTSYLLQGQINVTQQGVCVPVIYGEGRVGSVVGAAAYSVSDFTPSNNPESVTSGTYTDISGNSGYAGFGGGKSSGPGASGGSAADTLFSKATVTLMDILSEGEITGLLNGPQSIFFNNIPLLAEDGVTWNFLGVSWQICLGTPDQTPVPGFPGATITTPIGVEFYYSTPYTITTPNTTADQCRVTIELPGLYSVDQSTGYVSGSNVLLKIEAGIGSSFVTVVNDNINGKCSSAYQRSYLFNLPGFTANVAQSYNIRITRLTTDSNNTLLVNASYLSEYDLITNHQIMYSDTAYIVLTVDAESFGSNIPQRSYDISGVKVKIPANYNPVTRLYSTTGTGTSGGTWDGVTTTLATTSNNAWVLLDMLSNTRYGLGLFDNVLVNTKFDLYVIAQYCDGTVSNGLGGTEPRYQFNGVVNAATNAYTLLQTMASTFRGMIYFGGGQIVVTADMPLSPVKLVTQANVIGGTFTYEGTPLNSRHNQATVQWLDPGSQWQTSYEVVDNPSSLASRGIFDAQIVGYGVTSRGLAHRLAQWLLYSDNFQTETVSYSVSFDNLDVRPGQIVAILDNRYAGVRMGGRLRGNCTATQFVLDCVFTPQSGETYTINVTNPDGTLLLNQTIASFGTDSPTDYPYIFQQEFNPDTTPFSNAITATASGTLIVNVLSTTLLGNISIDGGPCPVNLYTGSGNFEVTFGTYTYTYTIAGPFTVAIAWESSTIKVAVNGTLLSTGTVSCTGTNNVVNIYSTSDIASVFANLTIYPQLYYSYPLFAMSTSGFTPYAMNFYESFNSGTTSGEVYAITAVPTGTMIITVANSTISGEIILTGGAVAISVYTGSGNLEVVVGGYNYTFSSVGTTANIAISWSGTTINMAVNGGTTVTGTITTTGANNTLTVYAGTGSTPVQVFQNVAIFAGAFTGTTLSAFSLQTFIPSQFLLSQTLVSGNQSLVQAIPGIMSGTLCIAIQNSGLAGEFTLTGGTVITLYTGSNNIVVVCNGVWSQTIPVNTSCLVAIGWTSTTLSVAVDGGVVATTSILFAGMSNMLSIFTETGVSAVFYNATLYPVGNLGFELANMSTSSFSPTSSTEGPYTVVYFASPVAQVPAANAVYLLSATTLTPRQFQIISVSESAKGKFDVFGLAYNIAKFDYIEYGIYFNATLFSELPNQITSAVQGPVVTTFPVQITASITGTTLVITAVSNAIALTEGVTLTDTTGNLAADTFITTVVSGAGGVGDYLVNNSQTVASEQMTATVTRGITVHATLSGVGANTDLIINVAWIAPGDSRVIGYKVMLVNSSGNAAYYTTPATSIQITDLPPDTYTVFVASMTINGQMSPYVEASNSISPTGQLLALTGGAAPVTATGFAPAAVTGLTAVGGIRSVVLYWTPPTSTTIAGYTVFRCSTNNIFFATAVSTVQAASFVDTDYAHLTPGSGWYYWVQPISTTGVVGAVASPAFAITSLVNTIDLALGSVTASSYASTGSSTVSLTTNPTTGSYALVNLAVTFSSSVSIGAVTFVVTSSAGFSESLIVFINESGISYGSVSATMVDTTGVSPVTYTCTVESASAYGGGTLTVDSFYVSILAFQR